MKKHLAVAIGAALTLAGAGIAEAGGRSGGGHSGGGGARHSGGHSGGHSGWHSGGHSHGHYRHHNHGSRVVVVGSAFYGYGYPGYYYPPSLYYNYPPAPAPVYIEQGHAPGAQGDWFYCPQYRVYYPQVQDCPGGWQRVAPQPH